MKTNPIVSALLLLVGASTATPTTTLGDCKNLCKDARQSILVDLDQCKKAIKIDPKLFHTCVKGAKKSFDQACLMICTKAELTVSSYEACQVMVRGQKNIDWCRKGYDSILQNIESLLVEQEKLAEEEIEEEPEEHGNVENVPVEETAKETKPIQTEPTIDPEENEPVENQPGESEPASEAISEPVEIVGTETKSAENSLEAESDAGSKDEGRRSTPLRGSAVVGDDIPIEQQQRASEVAAEEAQEEAAEATSIPDHGVASSEDGATDGEDRLEL